MMELMDIFLQIQKTYLKKIIKSNSNFGLRYKKFEKTNKCKKKTIILITRFEKFK